MLILAPSQYQKAINTLVKRAKACAVALNKSDERISYLLFKGDKKKIQSLEDGAWISKEPFERAVKELEALEKCAAKKEGAENATS